MDAMQVVIFIGTVILVGAGLWAWWLTNKIRRE